MLENRCFNSSCFNIFYLDTVLYISLADLDSNPFSVTSDSEQDCEGFPKGKLLMLLIS